MRKIILLIAFLLAISFTPQANAADQQAGSSAKLTPQDANQGDSSDPRVVALQHVFKKYHSPLLPYASLYVKYADKYGIDWRLLPSISGTESTFGNYYIYGTYNAYGWGSGEIAFNGWEDGINTIDKALKENYVNQGADTVDKIAPIYAASSHWAASTHSFMNEINNEYISTSSEHLSMNL